MLAVIGKIGTAGGNGHAIEFAGSAIRDLSIEGRMTICNMSIEAGARVGMVAADEKPLNTSKVAHSHRRAPIGMPPLKPGKTWSPTPTRCSTPWSSSTLPRSSRK